MEAHEVFGTVPTKEIWACKYNRDRKSLSCDTMAFMVHGTDESLPVAPRIVLEM